MPIHLLSGMKGKFAVTEVNATNISSIPGPSPRSKKPVIVCGEISLVGGGK